MKITIDPVWRKTKIEDDIILIATLYDAYNKKTDKGEVIVLDNPTTIKYFDDSDSVSVVKNIKTLINFITKKILFFLDDIDTPFHNKTYEVDIYRIKIDWTALDDYASILHDTEAISPFGRQKQAIILKDLIIKEAIILKSGKFEVTEKILGSYTAEMFKYGEYSHEERKDGYIAFMKTLKTLENNGFLKILDTRFDFNAWPEPINSKGILDNYTPTDEYAFFYPAEHCHVLIEIVEKNKTINSKVAKQDTNKLNKEYFFQKENFKISFKKTFYNSKTATLILNDIKIQIPPYTNQERLCKVVFSSKNSMKKYWSWDEIIVHKGWNQPEFADDSDFWRRIYNAAGEVNTKIAVKTGVEDFFIKTPIGTLKINPIHFP